ncbi:hypothetical protein FKR81_22415 [Lentzea tibetensis]|uniref:Uncharacterized protein n=1 Tax=Lentzea tibetensis TaxID=2591470 RepID=A0A563EQT3_9PSEU|nr:hypothetical protein [Lentzea tibetensis]TWP49987.1 hypothetical protein FKR81_22415 [Lentzea tibetensis]
MTSIAEVQVALEQVCEQLRESYRTARGAQQDLDEAVALLSEVSETHHESLLPPEFARAKERFPDVLELIVTTLERIQRLSAEL